MGEAVGVTLISGGAAAAAWARTGWIDPAVIAAVVIGLWHSFGENRTEMEARALFGKIVLVP